MLSPETAAQLTRWREAGLLEAAQADAIAAFEAEREPAPPPPPPGAGRAAPDLRTGAAEAVGYLGAAFAVGALGLLLFDLWERMTTGGQLTVTVLLTAVLAGAAVAVHGTRSAAMHRLASVLSLGAVVGVAWSAGIVGSDVLDLAGRDVALLAAAAATAAALPAYLLRQRALPLLTVLTSAAVLVEVLATRGELPSDPFWYALPVAAVAGVAVLLGVGGYLRPAPVATTAGGIVAITALQVGSFGDLRTLALVFAIAVAGGAVATAVVAGAPHHLAVGAIGLFVLVPQLVTHLFGDAIGAPATLLVTGLLLVLLAVGLGRARREVREAGAS